MNWNILAGLDPAEQMRAATLAVVLCAAVVDDMRGYRISNRIIGIGAALALFIGIVDCVVRGSLTCILDSCIGGGISFLAAFAVYAVRGLGAGDVKLFMVCGMLIGYKYVGIMFIESLAAAVVTGFAETVMGSGRQIRIRNTKMHAAHFSLGILAGNAAVMASRIM